MKKAGMILLVILIVMQLFAGSGFDKYRKEIEKRKDLFYGYGTADTPEEAEDSARLELAKSISVWYLTERGMQNKISYSKRDKYEQMVLVWLGSMEADLQSMKEADSKYEEVCTISRETIKENYQLKEAEIKGMIRRGEDALELNKLGIYFRNFYMTLVEIDLLAGKEIIIEDKVWSADDLIAAINKVAESFAIKVVGNSFENGNRRLILQLLYGRRPVNDLRLSIIVGEKNRAFSSTDRYMQVDLFGYEYSELDNITFSIDVQDKLTHIWGYEVEKLSLITGMDGYEAYRTIPLKPVEFAETSWQNVRIPLEPGEELLEARLRNLLESNETGIIVDSEIFSDDQVKKEYQNLQEILKLRNNVFDASIKRIKLAEGSIWRGFNVQVQYAGGLVAMTNLVVKTDNEANICGVWLGMKPLDFRLISRQDSDDGQNRLMAAVEDIERQYSAAVCGKGNEIEGFPACPPEGWYWSEMEDVNVEVMENAVIYNYRLTVAGENESWEFELKGIKD